MLGTYGTSTPYKFPSPALILDEHRLVLLWKISLVRLWVPAMVSYNAIDDLVGLEN